MSGGIKMGSGLTGKPHSAWRRCMVTSLLGGYTRYGLPVNPDPILTTPDIAPLALHDTAAKALKFLATMNKIINTGQVGGKKKSVLWIA